MTLNWEREHSCDGPIILKTGLPCEEEAPAALAAPCDAALGSAMAFSTEALAGVEGDGGYLRLLRERGRE